MARLPHPGSDDGEWGSILNDFLEQSHSSDGSLKLQALVGAGVVATNDARLSDQRQPIDGSVTDAKITVGGISPSKIAGTAMTQSSGDARYIKSSGGVMTGPLTLPSGKVTATNWYNVKDYGAKGDNSADDWAAIQAAINDARQGDIVYFPSGKYRVTQSLTLAYGIVLRGTWSGHFLPRVDTDTYIKPYFGNFTGSSLITIAKSPASSGSYNGSDKSGGVRLEGISLTGSNALNTSAGAIDAIYVSPGVHDVGLDRVSIYNFSGRGFVSDGAAGQELKQVTVSTCKGVGFEWLDSTSSGVAMTDAYLFMCYSQANAGGFKGVSPNAVLIQGCRAEFNTGHGYEFTGTHYSLILNSCNTDRNTKNGFHQRLTGTRPVVYDACIAKRDGSNDEVTLLDNAGFDIAGVGVSGSLRGCGARLIGCGTQTGNNDNNDGIVSPKYGISTTNIDRVSLTGCYFISVSTPIYDIAKCITRDNSTITGIANATTNFVSLNDSSIAISMGIAGSKRMHQLWTRNTGQRWGFGADDAAESGSNTGSNFIIERYNDAGAIIDTPLTLDRSTGNLLLTQGLKIAGAQVVISNTVRPTDHSLKAWTFDPATASTVQGVVSGTLYLSALYVHVDTVVTRLYYGAGTAANTPVASQNYIGIYNAAGTLVASASIDSTVTNANGPQYVTVSSTTLVAGNYWVGILQNAATPQQLVRSAPAFVSMANMGLSATSLRAATNGTGLTSLPSSITPSSNTASGAYHILLALY